MRYPAWTLNAREGCEGSAYAPPGPAAWGASTPEPVCPATPGFRPSLAARFAAALISAGEDPFLSARVFFSGGAFCAQARSTPQARPAMVNNRLVRMRNHRLCIFPLLDVHSRFMPATLPSLPRKRLSRALFTSFRRHIRRGYPWRALRALLSHPFPARSAHRFVCCLHPSHSSSR